MATHSHAFEPFPSSPAPLVPDALLGADELSRWARQAAAVAHVDACGAEVRGCFDAAGIEHLLIKGRAFARRLYREATERPYADTDLLVRHGEHQRAEQVLVRLGYRRKDRGGVLGLAPYSHTFERADGALIDLHWNLSGVTAAPEETWAALQQHAVELSVGGRLARVPGDAATALIVVLHNAHHGARWRSTQPDLERAAGCLDLPAWRAARQLAERLGAEEAFAAGLGLSAAGREIAQRLATDSAVSREYRIRADAVEYSAWALHRISAAHGTRQRLRMIAELIAPPPAAMRKFFPLARRGRGGLVTAYLLRPARLALSAPAGVRAYRRTRRSG